MEKGQVKTVLEVIEALKAGKKVKIKTPCGFQPLNGWVYKGALETLEFYTNDKKFIKVTPDHRFFHITTDGSGEKINDSAQGFWVKAKDQHIGDYIATGGEGTAPDGNARIVGIENLGTMDIYDLSVDHPCHCYYGNGFINHNSAKSLITQHALVATVKKGGIPVLVDSEFAFNPHWYRSLGGDPNQIVYYQPQHILDAYSYMHNIIQTIRNKDAKVPITIVYDSIAASPSKFEVDNGLEKHDMGKRAMEHGKGIRQMMGFVTKNNVTWLAVNQVRSTFCVIPQTKIKWRKRSF